MTCLFLPKGFHEVMEDISQRATDRRGLLVKVWRLFGRLWDSSLQVVFDSEVLALGAEREQALLEIDMLQRELEAARAENGMLRSKVNEMVNHALTTAEQDRHTSSSSARLVEELDRAQRVWAPNICSPPFHPEDSPCVPLTSRKDLSLCPPLLAMRRAWQNSSCRLQAARTVWRRWTRS